MSSLTGHNGRAVSILCCLVRVVSICMCTTYFGQIATHADEPISALIVDGITYSNVTFGTITSTSVTMFHSAGVARLALSKLPPEIQQRFTQINTNTFVQTEIPSDPEKATWLDDKNKKVAFTRADIINKFGTPLSEKTLEDGQGCVNFQTDKYNVTVFFATIHGTDYVENISYSRRNGDGIHNRFAAWEVEALLKGYQYGNQWKQFNILKDANDPVYACYCYIRSDGTWGASHTIWPDDLTGLEPEKDTVIFSQSAVMRAFSEELLRKMDKK